MSVRKVLVCFCYVGLLIGVGAVSFVGCAKRTPILQADDSPVTVRGGSVDILSQPGKSWASVASCPKNTWVLTADNTSISIGAVEQINSAGKPGPVQSVAATGLSSNWTLTIAFRDNSGATDSTTTIQISTNNPCKGSGSISDQQIYLQDEESTPGSFSSQTALDPDQVVRWRFNVGQCAGATSTDPRDWKCNHISQISATGVQFTDVKTGAVVAGPFYCREGDCDIGFDK
jgi:hypothetical protein